MHNSIGVITRQKLCLIYHHRLIHFPSKKGIFPTNSETFFTNRTTSTPAPWRSKLHQPTKPPVMFGLL